MKKLILVLLTSLWMVPVFATAPVESDGSANIAAGANTIFLSGSSGTKGSFSHVIVWLSSGSSTVYITFNQGVTASSSNALLGSGASIAYGLPGFSAATNQINYFGNGTTGTISWMAW